MSDWTIFGERLSHIMREYDVSLSELSRRTGTTLTTLHRYATCKRVPRATEILKCADALGVTCDYLLGLSDDPHLTGKGERIIGNGGKKKIADLISRQAAIDVIRKDKIDSDCLKIMDALGHGNEALTVNMTCDRHIQLLKNLPSAQPTYADEEIQKMQDLEQAQIEKAYQLGYEEGKKDAQPEPHWIQVSEKLPERGKEVLVTRDYDGREDHNKSCRYVETASCYGEEDDISWYSYSDEYKMTPRAHRVIAWKQLPIPYRPPKN